MNSKNLGVEKVTQEDITKFTDNVIESSEEIQKLFREKNIIPNNARVIIASAEKTSAPMGLGIGHQGVEIRITFASLLKKEITQ